MGNNKTDQQSGPGYETHELHIGPILIVAFISLILFVVALYVLDQKFTVTKEKLVEDVVSTPVSISLRELRAHEDEELGAYKVIDSEKGVYQIPIKKAMEILANQAYQNREQGNRKAP